MTRHMQGSQTVVAPLRKASFEARDVYCLSLIGLAALTAWRQVVLVAQLAWRTDEYTHILLVIPISLSLIYLEHNKLRRHARFSPLEGMILGMLSVGLAIGAMRAVGEDAALALTILSLVMFWMACIVAYYGRPVFLALLFPFLFLFLLVPAPAASLDKAVVFLQAASTQATYALFNLIGLPVLKDGFVLSFPTLRIEVAKECSGIRSSIMLLITGLLLAHLFLRSLWSKVVFVLFIVPLSVAKNAIRIFTLSVLGMYVNPGFLHGSLHHQGGIVFFLIALGILALLLWTLQKVDNMGRRQKLKVAVS